MKGVYVIIKLPNGKIIEGQADGAIYRSGSAHVEVFIGGKRILTGWEKVAIIEEKELNYDNC